MNGLYMKNDQATMCPVDLSENWNDDMRMEVLFAPFRSRPLNPLHYDRKMQFWTEAITAYFRKSHRCQLRMCDVEVAFIRKGKQPRCINEVLNDMIRTSKITASEAMNETGDQTGLYGYVWSAIKLVITPISWLSYPIWGSTVDPKAITKPSSNTSKTKVDDDVPIQHLNYIFPDVVKEKAAALYGHLQQASTFSPVASVLTREQFVGRASEQEIHRDDVELIVNQLVKDKKIHLLWLDDINGQVMKLATANTPLHSLTDIEKSTILLKDIASKLEAHINEEDQKIETIEKKVKKLVAEGSQRQLALRLLRKKRTLKQSRDRREQTMTNISTMLDNIEISSRNKSVLDACSMASDAMKKFMKTNDMSVDKVHDVMDDMNETISEHQEIADALSTSVVSNVSDNDELEDELEELLREEEEEKKLKEAEDIPDLPTVPSESPRAQSVVTDTGEFSQIEQELIKLRERISDLKL